MPELTVRPMREGEEGVYCTILAEAFNQDRHQALLDDTRREVRLDRKHVALINGVAAGVASSFGTELAVPGGQLVAAAALDGGAVRPDFIRRGVRSALMRAQIDDWVQKGEVVAVLNASEAQIFEHFGFGSATESKGVRVDRVRAVFRPDTPDYGFVRLLHPGEALQVLPALYEKIGLHRPGMISRVHTWWRNALYAMGSEPYVVVHTGSDGDDGFAMYRPVDLSTFQYPNPRVALDVSDMHATDHATYISLWRSLLGRDLVAEIRAARRPVDEPLAAMLVDSRACEVVNTQDQLWLRPIDVLKALQARSFNPAPSLVMEVCDRTIKANNGRYKISKGLVTRTEEPPSLRLDVHVVGMLYLGGWRVSTLASLGRVEVVEPEALACADALFRVDPIPWCGTFF